MPSRPPTFRPHQQAPRYNQRRKTAERGYGGDWQNVAEQRRKLDTYLCQDCLASGQLEQANTVDHIIPVHVRPDWRLMLGNTRVLCMPHHKRKTDADNRKYGSSEATSLTAEQIEARRVAMAMTVPPRGDS